MKKTILRARPVCLAAVCCTLAWHAGTARAQVPPFELEPVTVTGSGTPRTLGSEIAATSVLTRGDIERAGARDAVSVLNLLGTTQVEQQGGAGTLASVRIRGAETRDTLVLIDGVPITDVTSGQALIQQIPADMIERVEVVRGNLSALYGANATGGVIQIFTRRGQAGAGLAPQVSAGVGSRDTRSLAASLSAGGEVWSARLGAGSERTGGFSAGSTANSNPDDDGNKRRYATLAADLQFAPGQNVGLDLRQVDGTVMYDSPRFGVPTDTHEERLVQSGAALRGRHALGKDWTLAWRVGDSQDKRATTEVSDLGGMWRNKNKMRNEVRAVELAATMTEGLVARVGLERLSQSTDSASHLRQSRDTDVLRAGLTYDASWGSVQANLRHDETSDFGGAGTWLLGGRYRLGESLSLIANASTSFTPPTLDFLFFDCGMFPCSNPNLRPEKARNVEAGLQWQHRGTLLRATLFAARYTDRIFNDENFVPQNSTGKSENQGIELSARHAVGAWSLLAEATFQDPKQADGQRPLRRAREQLALRADYQQPRWHAGAGVRTVGDRPDSGGALPSYTVVDASAHWTVTPDWTVSAVLDNVLDRRYEPTLGYNGRPRMLFVGANWSPRQ
jgi:vitamin B12 transporter